MKRIKKVFSTSEIPHKWILQQQQYARNQQGNLFFEGKSIFSYGHHFEIARIIGDKAVLVTIEWKKSRTWGNNPNCEAEIHFKDGSFERSPIYKASGCGYDKESTVIADVFNDYLKYKLWELSPEARKGGHGSGDTGPAPYGICIYSDNNPHYGGGIGTNCYYKIAEHIGGKFEHVSSGKTFDVFRYTEEAAK